jgi:hypothetical protein
LLCCFLGCFLELCEMEKADPTIIIIAIKGAIQIIGKGSMRKQIISESPAFQRWLRSFVPQGYKPSMKVIHLLGELMRCRFANRFVIRIETFGRDVPMAK